MLPFRLLSRESMPVFFLWVVTCKPTLITSARYIGGRLIGTIQGRSGRVKEPAFNLPRIKANNFPWYAIKKGGWRFKQGDFWLVAMPPQVRGSRGYFRIESYVPPPKRRTLKIIVADVRGAVKGAAMISNLLDVACSPLFLLTMAAAEKI